jgi:hypothetical protein
MDDTNPAKLRELGSWYREFAERAGNAAVWDGRLRTAEYLDAEAERIEHSLQTSATEPPFRVSTLRTDGER